MLALYTFLKFIFKTSKPPVREENIDFDNDFVVGTEKCGKGKTWLAPDKKHMTEMRAHSYKNSTLLFTNFTVYQLLLSFLNLD